MVALAWAFVSVPVGDRTLYGHLVRSEVGADLAERWQAFQAQAAQEAKPRQVKKKPAAKKVADKSKKKRPQLAKATEPRRKGEPTVQTEKGADDRVDRLKAAAAALKNAN
mgnify:CR=1 FL=1